tara:strand:+ start:3175 stop:4299 length:1125 start_codon:yes stop_codon:yes gene_type:complete
LISLLAALWLRGGTDATPFAILESLAEDIGNWYASLHEEKPSIPDAPEKASTTPGGSQSTFSESSVFSPLDHTTEDQNICGRPRTKSRSETDKNLIYKWVDEGGQTHMSDEQPKGVIASVMDMSMQKRDFTYQIIPDGISVPINFPGQLAAGSKRMYDTWHFFLGEERLRQSNIEVLLIGGPGRFDAYHAKTSPNSKPVNGFYSMGKNQAVVSFDPDNIARTLGTTFHEISHLITASHLGPTPPWLTEGLAEYFETMQVKDQAGTIYPNQAHIKLLKQTPLPSLRDYLAIDRPEWHRAQRDRNYAIAWSLMNFLLQGAPGMYALQEVIQQAEANFCQPFSAVAVLDQAYPGGIQRLEQDWRSWLENNQFRVQQT